jgi:hypothetical protein
VQRHLKHFPDLAAFKTNAYAERVNQSKHQHVCFQSSRNKCVSRFVATPRLPNILIQLSRAASWPDPSVLGQQLSRWDSASAGPWICLLKPVPILMRTGAGQTGVQVVSITIISITSKAIVSVYPPVFFPKCISARADPDIPFLVHWCY